MFSYTKASLRAFRDEETYVSSPSGKIIIGKTLMVVIMIILIPILILILILILKIILILIPILIYLTDS
jgi:hypothetical protein